MATQNRSARGKNVKEGAGKVKTKVLEITLRWAQLKV